MTNEEREHYRQVVVDELINTEAFLTQYPAGMPAAQFVDELNANTNGCLSQAERDQLVNSLSAGMYTRAQALRKVYGL